MVSKAGKVLELICGTSNGKNTGEQCQLATPAHVAKTVVIGESNNTPLLFYTSSEISKEVGNAANAHYDAITEVDIQQSKDEPPRRTFQLWLGICWSSWPTEESIWS